MRWCISCCPVTGGLAELQSPAFTWCIYDWKQFSLWNIYDSNFGYLVHVHRGLQCPVPVGVMLYVSQLRARRQHSNINHIVLHPCVILLIWQFNKRLGFPPIWKKIQIDYPKGSFCFIKRFKFKSSYFSLLYFGPSFLVNYNITVLTSWRVLAVCWRQILCQNVLSRCCIFFINV